MTAATLALLLFAACVVYLAPTQTLAAAAGLAALAYPDAAAIAVSVVAIAVIGTAGTVIWRQMRDTGFALVWGTARRASSFKTALDWSGAPVGDPAPCTICGRPALMRSPRTGAPCHKTCAEQWLAQRDAQQKKGQGQ